MLLVKTEKGDYRKLSTDEITAIIKKVGGFGENKTMPKTVVFHQKGKNDTTNQRVVYPASHDILPEFTGLDDKGVHCTYRYCENQKKIIADGGVVYEFFPKLPSALGLLFTRANKSKTIPMIEKDKIAYLLLYFDCKQSPFNKTSGRLGFYDVYNPRVQAEAILIAEKERIVAESKAMQLSEEELRTYLSSTGVVSAHTLDHSVALQMVLEAAKKDPGGFINSLSDARINILGDIQLFMDKGLVFIKEYPGKDKQSEWRIGFGEQKGDHICNISPANPANRTLLTYLLNNSDLYDELRAVIRVDQDNKGVDVEEKKAETFADKISKAQNDGYIDFNRAERKVIKINPKNGHIMPGGGFICDITTPLQWKKELEDFLCDPENNKELILFEKHLTKSIGDD